MQYPKKLHYILRQSTNSPFANLFSAKSPFWLKSPIFYSTKISRYTVYFKSPKTEQPLYKGAWSQGVLSLYGDSTVVLY